MGFWLDRQTRPVSGRVCRGGRAGKARRDWVWPWAGRWRWCACFRWLAGGIAIFLNLQPSAWGWLVADAAFFALAALAEEIAFRGYGFQRFAHAVGPLGAALGFAAYYAIVQAQAPGSNRASFAVSVC
jgi:membrane protease YdiL (CAAX protease family)